MITNDIQLQRFLAKIEFPFDEENECWIWKGWTQKEYGVMQIEYRPYYAHRLSYDHFWGPIPKGMHLDHLCRNRACVNPRHLEPISLTENLVRANKIYPIYDENGVEIPRLCCRCHEKPRARSNKYCLKCHAENTREYREEHPMALQERQRQIEYLREYRKTHPEKRTSAQIEVRRIQNRERLNKNPVKEAARHRAEKALRTGELIKPDHCEACGASKVEMHHLDYAQPLLIAWLCRSCHFRLHALENE